MQIYISYKKKCSALQQTIQARDKIKRDEADCETKKKNTNQNQKYEQLHKTPTIKATKLKI
jgi:cytidylate kinase